MFSDQKLSKNEVSMFLENLTTKITNCETFKKPVNNCEIYRHVLQEYLEFTKFYLNLKSCCLTADLNKIKVTTVDEHNREHFVEIAINYNDSSDIFEIVEYDLPYERENFKASSSLRTVYDNFKETLDKLQPFFNLMEALDNHCCILDPITPTRRINYRRVWIGT